MCFDKFQRLSACIAAKCLRKSTSITEKRVFPEAVTLLMILKYVNMESSKR